MHWPVPRSILTSLLLGSTKLCPVAVQYRILRQKGTEPAGSGLYNKHKVPSLAILWHPACVIQLTRANTAFPFQLRYILLSTDVVAGGGHVPLCRMPDASLHVSAVPVAEAMAACWIPAFCVLSPVQGMHTHWRHNLSHTWWAVHLGGMVLGLGFTAC